MIAQHENGDESATTRSAVSAGTINITNGAAQTQDVAGLSRDTANTNGKVSAAPDVNQILNKQADMMQAAQAAGQAVSQGIGAYADMKSQDAANAVDAAAKSGDPQALAAAVADYIKWREGGDSRAELQAAGGALIGGLAGGAFGAVGGAAGAGQSSKMADQSSALAQAVGDASGSSLIGNISGNILSGLAGASMASGVNLYNQGNDTDSAARDARVKKALGDALGSVPNFDSLSLGQLASRVDDLAGQFVGMMQNTAKQKMGEGNVALAAQGAANGAAAVVGTGGAKPPTPGTGGVLVNGAVDSALAGGASSGGYQPDNATFATDPNARPSGFRKKTVQDAWNSAADGSMEGTKVCPRCGKDVTVAPGHAPEIGISTISQRGVSEI
ncbi:hypothetical protein [Paraburkholderia sp. J94]|uniref:hypothetical protein n=1 Tax=Paraburkholderia sp. J94 TaxID=2805441 RepID=UPI002AB25566|nr:hypothetical protein [Paraburkholderia sp. J94]